MSSASKTTVKTPNRLEALLNHEKSRKRMLKKKIEVLKDLLVEIIDFVEEDTVRENLSEDMVKTLEEEGIIETVIDDEEED